MDQTCSAVFTLASIVMFLQILIVLSYVLYMLYITEDDGIRSLENRRTRIWQFRKRKTGDSS